MADAKKCDRCGSFYDRMRDPCKGFVLSEYLTNNGLIKVVDLCPTCLTMLNLWMEGKADIIGIDTYRPVCGSYEGEDDIHEV